MNISKGPGLGLVGSKPDIGYTPKNLPRFNSLLGDTIPNSGASGDDTVTISDEGKSLFYEHNNLTPYDEKFREIARLLRELNESSDDSDNPYDEKLKCIIIASRIINGDKVPPKDMKFLAEKEPGMYSNAMLLRRQNEKPKKYKSLLKDKEDDLIEGQAETAASNEPTGSSPTETAPIESGEGIEVSE